MSKKRSADHYEVGYGKPPKNSQFQKGVSGNPSGRPRKACDLDAALLREANSLITINDNGRKTRVSKHAVIIKQMLNNAMKGKQSDQRMYFALYPQALEKAALLAAQKDAESRRTLDDLTDEELMEIIRASPEHKD